MALESSVTTCEFVYAASAFVFRSLFANIKLLTSCSSISPPPSSLNPPLQSYPLLNVMYFSSCTFGIVIFAYKSHVIIRAMFQSAAKEWSDVAAAAERRNLLYVLCLSASFLASWALCAVHFLAMPLFGISMDWPPIFFDLVVLTISFNCCVSPFVSVFFDTSLKNLMLSYFWKKNGSVTPDTFKSSSSKTKTASNNDSK